MEDHNISLAPSNPERRDFISQLSVLTALAGVFPSAVLAQRRLDKAINTQPQWLSNEPWQTLAVVQEHLLPASVNTPGASDINAIHYLYNTLQNIHADAEDKEFISNGVGWLNDLTNTDYQKAFAELGDDKKESVLRKIEQSQAGENWLSLLLTYLIEALLSDPVYGGNKASMGWKWLQHKPGFPTPIPGKLWYQLGKPVRKNFKSDA